MPNSYKRSTRVGALIQHTVSEIVREIRDLTAGLVTIMGVKLTDDLQDCKILYSVFGSEEDKKTAAEILKDKTKEIRRELAMRLNLRRTPTLVFVYDNTNETASKIFDLLKKIEDEQSK
ncbi:MAG: 30S ribosome-binding factor RbfA [Endomicrobium sp.]|jgi:ribosome-binding factor A|nr:30S ribosome-binding factor RbfA [Endomicrobium sp.]